MGENPVWVMASRSTALMKVRGNNSASRGRKTSVPPATSVVKTVPKEPSKCTAETLRARVARSKPHAAIVAVTAATNAPCPTRTPFGVLVVPDV